MESSRGDGDVPGVEGFVAGLGGEGVVALFGGDEAQVGHDVADAGVEAFGVAFFLDEEGFFDAFGGEDAPFDEDFADGSGADVVGVGGRSLRLGTADAVEAGRARGWRGGGKSRARLMKRRSMRGWASAMRWKMGQALTQSPHQGPERQRTGILRRKEARSSRCSGVRVTES